MSVITGERLMIDKTYDISALEREANRRIQALQAQYPGLEEINGPRTIHYYGSKGLLESPGRRDGKAHYSRATLNRLVFIRLLQAHTVWNLEQIRQVFDAVPPEQITRIVEGEEALEVMSWTPPPKRSKHTAAEVTVSVSETDAAEFRRISESFARMAEDFAQSAAQYAEIANKYAGISTDKE